MKVEIYASPPVQLVCVCERPLPFRDEDDDAVRCLPCGRPMPATEAKRAA